jgi:hypothetical protein
MIEDWFAQADVWTIAPISMRLDVRQAHMYRQSTTHLTEMLIHCLIQLLSIDWVTKSCSTLWAIFHSLDKPASAISREHSKIRAQTNWLSNLYGPLRFADAPTFNRLNEYNSCQALCCYTYFVQQLVDLTVSTWLDCWFDSLFGCCNRAHNDWCNAHGPKLLQYHWQSHWLIGNNGLNLTIITVKRMTRSTNKMRYGWNAECPQTKGH